MLIGLTGKYCAGKNHIALLLEKKGLPVLDVDKLGYEALEAEKEAVFARFGADLQKSDGGLDRRLLGERVFGKPAELAALEALVHPYVDRLIDEWIKKNGEIACVINAALLHRAAVFKRLDRIILVTAPFFIRLFRAMRRDGLSLKAVLRRFKSQKDFNTHYLSINDLSINAEIYRVGNPNFAGFPHFMENPRKKLERRIDKIIKIIEGII
ncbi:MAG: dephospho-CoA kinase [Treponema sp.]|jgi:dephospho-CoA kinase|nr:dephospho-CoA kinase [Treponema sp.]